MAELFASRYRLLEVLRDGPTGVVWRAEDILLDREVALRELRQPGRTQASSIERLLMEARAASRLHHPNIATIHDVVTGSDRVLIAMELVEGRTLAALVGSAGPRPANLVRAMMAQVARALAYAHAAGVIHGQLTAGDVLWTVEERAVVEGFTGGSASASSTAVDVRSWGQVTYELLTGSSPEGGTVDGARVVPQDPSLGDLITRCLSDEPSGRPADGGELVRQLSAPDPGSPLAGATETSPADPRNTALVAMSALLLLAVVAVAAVLLAGPPARTTATGPTGSTVAIVTTTATTTPPTTVPPTTLPMPTTTVAPVRRDFPAAGVVPQGLYQTTHFRPQITMELNDGWQMEPPPEAEDHLFLIRRPPQPTHPWLLIFQVHRVFGYEARPRDIPGPGDLANWLRLHPRLSVRQLTTATVGGQQATLVDVEVASGYSSPSCTAACVLLFSHPNYDIRLHAGDRMRVYLLAAGGQRLAIVVDAPEDQFDAMLPTAEAVIRTIAFP